MSGYDTVIAVTQKAVNFALTEWLQARQQQVALYYTVGTNGKYVKTTKDQAQVVFEGELAPPGGPAEIVTLRSARGEQTVQYNLIFNKALFEYKPLGVVARETTDERWVMGFDIHLALEPSVLEKLPQKVREEIEKGITHFDEDTFSIQRLWADLTTAALSSFEGIDGMPEVAKDILGGVVREYLKEQQETAEMIFGAAVLHKGGAAAPTFAPTALDFCVTYAKASTGAESPSGLDTLNYLLMTEGRPLPAEPPQELPFSPIEDASVAGAVWIRGGLFGPYLLGQMAPILPVISPTFVCDAEAHGDDGEIRTGPPETGKRFTAVEPPASNGAVGVYEYSPGIEPSSHNYCGGSTSAEASYRAAAEVLPGWDLSEKPDPGMLLLCGEIAFSGKITTRSGAYGPPSQSGGGSSDENELPPTTWKWKAALRLAADISTGGQLDLLIGETEFDAPPTVQEREETWLEKWLRYSTSGIVTAVLNLGGIRQEIETTTLPAIQKSIEEAAEGPNHFVFPGAKTFVFSEPQFEAGADLRARITYEAA